MYNLFLDGVQMPVTPSKISTKINGKNKTLTLMNDGEINKLKRAGLTDISFEVDFPNTKYPYAVYPNGFKPADYYLELIEQMKIERKTFQFILNRTKPNGDLLFDTNMTVSLEDYEIIEDAENGFDITVSINLKQYRYYGNKKLVVQAKETTTTIVKVEKVRSTNGKTAPKTHTVVKGDTLWAICKKYYGKATMAMTDELAKKNNIKNPNLIYPGDVIKL